MVTAELAARRDIGLGRALMLAYAIGILVLFLVTAATAGSPAVRVAAHQLFAIPLRSNLLAPRPSDHRALWLLATNLRATLPPLLAVAIGAHRWRGYRAAIHVLIAWSLLWRLAPIGATLGIYGPRAGQHLPHLPLELYACIAGPTVWLTAVRHGVSRRQLLLVALSILLALIAAAPLETWADPVL